MTILSKAMGEYQTNCYIIKFDSFDIVIDPGIGATAWVLENTTNLKAILNTHGHFDHIWSNKELKEKLNIPIFCPQGDCFMLENDPFSYGTPICQADIEVKPDETVTIEGIDIVFYHFSGHTPGCSAITIDDNMFSGDFIFQNSIGRSDFPYSSSVDMKKSIEKILTWKHEFNIYPGHGPSTTLKQEKIQLNQWLNYL
ncbi:MAG: MBL fold metallo-hydrolase [Epsilonproteobacteria bacterium]|nr:MAG: MBL fold metallo-hydrolase [Campylobacterota bacterium]